VAVAPGSDRRLLVLGPAYHCAVTLPDI